MNTDTLAEATAVIRRTGAWSVCLGPWGLLARFYQRSYGMPDLERRLGMMATCVGQLLTAALAEDGIETQTMRVVLRSVRSRSGASASHAGANLVGRIAIEGEANTQAAQVCCGRRVQRDPLFLLMTREFQSIEMTVETQPRVHVWIC